MSIIIKKMVNIGLDLEKQLKIINESAVILKNESKDTLNNILLFIAIFSMMS